MKMVRNLVLLLLAVTVLAPIVLYTNTASKRDFLEDVPPFMPTGDGLHLNVLPQETAATIKEPVRFVYSDQTVRSEVGEHKSTRVLSATDEDHHFAKQNPITIKQVIDSVKQTANPDPENPNTPIVASQHMQNLHPKPISQKGNHKEVLGTKYGEKPEATIIADTRLRQLKDQLIQARLYLSIPSIKNNPHMTRELRLHMKEIARVMGNVAKDSDLPNNAHDKLKEMEQSLAKARQVQDDCDRMVKKLQAMLQSTEDQLQAQKKQTMFLTQLTAKTLPKGLHCLPLRLTIGYHALNYSQKEFSNKEKLEDPQMYHYALFSDNVLAAAVVVNSTISNAKHPSRHVFHIVTDQLNYAAMRMWFLAYPPGKATVQVQNIEEFTWLNSSYSPVLKQLGSRSTVDYYFRAHHSNSDSNLKYRNPKYLSILNHLRFYLPEIFPRLNKVLFLDDDIVVQKDLSGLWSIDLKGNINGAVETCGESFHRFDRYLNFSNPLISNNFEPRACGWAYGMNLFDLQEWKRQNITEVYHRWQKLNHDRQLWKLGTLPPGLITFWKHTYPLNRFWHVLGLGYNPNMNQRDIERAAVVHFNGNMKPWLEIGISRYRGLWSKYVDYDNAYVRGCNITP